MNLSVRLFGILRERARGDAVEVSLPAEATVADVLVAAGERDDIGELLARVPVRIAVNREIVAADTAVGESDELALIPPVSGGSDVHVRVTGEPLDAGAVRGRVGRPAAGAIVVFEGTTRDVARLEYEAYEPMAQERIAAIVRDCVERHDLQAAAVEHRVGAVPLGEPSVVVAVSAAHREQAFAGAREAIDRIKAEAPIWKREVELGADGERSRWVEGTIPPLPERRS